MALEASLSLFCPLTRSANPEADPDVMRSEVCSIGWALFKKKHTDYTCTIEYEVWEGGVRLKTSLAVCALNLLPCEAQNARQTEMPLAPAGW